MRKILLLFAALLPILACGQQRGFTAFYNQYSGREGFTTVEITGDMIRMMGNMIVEKGSDADLSRMLNGIKSIKIVVSEHFNEVFIADMNKIVVNSPYKLMTSIVQGAQTTKFYFIELVGAKKQSGETLASEFLMLSQGGEDNVLINIVGELDIKKISKLSNIKIGGMEKFAPGRK